jgi:hypothetical protein
MTDPQPITRAFDVGASAFVSGTKFILSRGDWKTALAYANSATSVDPLAVAFNDVRLAVQSIQADADMWTARTYPDVVALASAVYDFGTNKAPIYLGKLGKLLETLGNDPSNETLLQGVEAIAATLTRSANDAQTAASASTAAIAAALPRQRSSERRLATIVSAYAQMYRTSESSAPEFPESLDAFTGALAEAWRKLAATLDSLLAWVRANVKEGKQFRADLSLDKALVEWRTASAAADDFRTNAYIKGPTLVAV